MAETDANLTSCCLKLVEEEEEEEEEENCRVNRRVARGCRTILVVKSSKRSLDLLALARHLQ
jgi:hypothetical protein